MIATETSRETCPCQDVGRFQSYKECRRVFYLVLIKIEALPVPVLSGLDADRLD